MEMKLRKTEKYEVLERINELVVNKLKAMRDGDWLGVEIAERWQLSSARQSELLAGKRIVSKPNLRNLIGGNFVTIEEIESLNLTDREKKYVYTEFAPFSDPELSKAVLSTTAAGNSPATVLKVFQEAQDDMKIDPLAAFKLLKEARAMEIDPLLLIKEAIAKKKGKK